jgi:hypothetical protein
MTKYYGPFRILAKLGSATYKLSLPSNAEIHPVFHVSQLKKHIGSKAIPQSNLSLITSEGYVKLQPVTVLDTRALPRRDDVVTQWKVQWPHLTEDQAMWEDKLFVKSTFPDFYQQTIRQWWPVNSSCGQEQPQVGRAIRTREKPSGGFLGLIVMSH